MSERAEQFAELARRYGELGWALVRLEGKVPKGRDWQLTDPDPDPDHLAGLWAEWGKRWNLGAVLGPSGLAVVEYDSEQGAAKLRELFGGRPATPTARTGSGRLHFYFRAQAGLEKRTREGIELRAGPHQCVVPPSEHPDTGEPYAWLEGREPWTQPLAELPAGVLEFFGDARRNGVAAVVAEEIPAGRRNDELASLAGTMRRRGMSEAEILAALRIVNEERCRPPLGEPELATIARSIGRYQPVPADPLERILPTPKQEPSEPPVSKDPGASRELVGLTYAEARRAEIPETSELVAGLVDVGTVGLIAGLPFARKSWAALELASKVAAGKGEVFGRFPVVSGGPVVYVWQDDSLPKELERLQIYAARHDYPDELPLRFLLNEGITLPDDLDALAALIERDGAVLLVVDSLYNALGPTVKRKDEEVSVVLAQLKAELCDRTGAGAALVDHAPWPSEGNRGQRRAYGSVFKTAAVRWSIHLEADGKDDTRLHVEASGNNVAGFRRTPASWDEEQLEIRLLEVERERSEEELDADVRALLSDGQARSTSAVRRAVTGRNERVDSALERLRERGEVADLARGGGAWSGEVGTPRYWKALDSAEETPPQLFGARSGEISDVAQEGPTSPTSPLPHRGARSVRGGVPTTGFRSNGRAVGKPPFGPFEGRSGRVAGDECRFVRALRAARGQDRARRPSPARSGQRASALA